MFLHVFFLLICIICIIWTSDADYKVFNLLFSPNYDKCILYTLYLHPVKLNPKTIFDAFVKQVFFFFFFFLIHVSKILLDLQKQGQWSSNTKNRHWYKAIFNSISKVHWIWCAKRWFFIGCILCSFNLKSKQDNIEKRQLCKQPEIPKDNREN